MHSNNFVTLLPISVSLVILSLAATTSGLSCDSDAFIFPMPCEGDICTAVRILSNGRPITVLECLNKNTNPHWRDLCSGLRDTNTTVTQCCIGEDSCSGQLKPRLPSEPPATGGLAPYRPVNDTEDDPSSDGLYVCTYDQTHASLNGHPGYCYGHSCFSSVVRHGGSVEQRWGCLDRDTRNISLVCGGSMNSEQEVYSCCTGGFRCNSHLNPQFPVITTATTEETTMLSTNPIPGSRPPGGNPFQSTPSTSSASQSPGQNLAQLTDPLNSFEIATVVIVTVLVPIILVVAIVALVILLLKRHQDKKKAVQLKPVSPSSSAGSPVSIESDLSDPSLRHSLA